MKAGAARVEGPAVSGSPARILALARRCLASGGCLTLATQGVRIWSEPLPFRMEGEELLCPVPRDSQTLANLRLSPRVSFSSGDPRQGWTVHGSGIARAEPGSEAAVRIAPYRLAVSRTGGGDPRRQVIEKRRTRWTLADPSPAEGRRPAGLARAAAFWLRAMRSVSFPLSILPVALGTAVGLMEGRFDPLVFLLALVGGVAAHAGINLVSDYNDFRKGVDTTDALSSHPGALVDEIVRPESILVASFLMFALAGAAGSLLMLSRGWPVLLFGLAGVAGGCLYTSGSLAYKYRGLGELFVSLLMGPLMVVGACYVQTGRLDALALLLSLALGSLVGSVTLANNLRDLIDDARAGVRTLPALLRVGPAKTLYYGMILFPYAVVGAAVALRLSAWPMLLAALSLPWAVGALRALAAAGASAEEIRAGAREGRYPLRSIRLHLRFGLLLILGCLLAALRGLLG